MTLLLASIGWGLLATGAVMHTWRHRHLRELLALHLDHERIPALLLTGIEVALAVALPAAHLADNASVRFLGGIGLVVALGFVAWIARLLSTRSTLPCACSFSRAPTTWLSLARACCVALVGLFVLAPSPADRASSVATMLVGAAVASAIFVIPEATSWPTVSRALMARVDAYAVERSGTAR